MAFHFSLAGFQIASLGLLGLGVDIADGVVRPSKVPADVVLAIIEPESQFTPEAASKKALRALREVMPVVRESYSLLILKRHRSGAEPARRTLSLADLFQRFGDWEAAVFRAYCAGPEDYNNREHDWLANAVSKKIYDFRRIIEKLAQGKNEAFPISELQDTLPSYEGRDHLPQESSSSMA